MTKFTLSFFAISSLFASCLCASNDSPSPVTTPSSTTSAESKDLSKTSFRIGIVNTKKCLDESKLGKQELANFEKMKKQMQTELQDKEKMLDDIESKLNDDDYMDSLSDEAAAELKRKKKAIRTEGMQLQSQFMETLQHANMKVIQMITEAIAKASKEVAKEGIDGQSIEAIFTDEACTTYSPSLDVSEKIIQKMNAMFDAESKESTPKSLTH